MILIAVFQVLCGNFLFFVKTVFAAGFMAIVCEAIDDDK